MMNSPDKEQLFGVYLGGRHVATLHRIVDYTWLTFERSYLDDPNRAVLGLRFEEDLRAKHAAHLRLPPWFSNLLPEGPLREWIGAARGAPLTREMELLAQVGRDLPGAVQVFEGESGGIAPAPVDREIVAEGPRRSPGNLWRFSLAGVGLKFSMLAQKDRFTAPAYGEGGDWIVKLPDPVHPAVPENEFAMMTLARRVGIEVPEIRLVDRDQIESLPDQVWVRAERLAYAVRRFDRDERRVPIHIEDLAQVRGFYPEDKYRGTFETVASILYRNRDENALLEFARRLAFNILISNGDAHLKNWSILYKDPRIPILAPAYDLVATSVYRPHNTPEDLGLKFCKTKRFEQLSASCFASLGSRLGVRVPIVDEVHALVERVLCEWPAVSESLSAHPKMQEGIEQSIQRGAVLLRQTRNRD